MLIRLFFLSLLAAALVIAGVLAYFVLTPEGSHGIVEYLLDKNLSGTVIESGKSEGTLLSGHVWESVTMGKLPFLPEETVFKARKITLTVLSIKEGLWKIDIHEGRMIIPGSDPVLFSGYVTDSSIEADIYAGSVDIEYLLYRIFGIPKETLTVKGTARDVDIAVTGNIGEPVIKGELLIEEADHSGVRLSACRIRPDLILKGVPDDIKLFGQITVLEGRITRDRTKVDLRRSTVEFKGDPSSPIIDIQGVSEIEGVKIDIGISGIADKPDVKLISFPPMPEERILFMLVTGKAWKGIDSSIENGKFSGELAGDFVDYLFGGEGDKLASRFGLRVVSFKYDEKTRAVAVSKDIGPRAQVGYGYEESVAEDKETTRSHTASAGYKVTDNITVEGSRKADTPDLMVNGAKNGVKPEDNVMIKFNKDF